MPGKKSYVTVTDQFCGAGGSSLGAVSAGAEVVLALNHWKLAIETHNTNFPDTRHECTDISACDPRRYPSTDILITSPECVNHSLAKGKKRAMYRQDLFGNVLIDPAEERSRATMWDVPRFAEYHGYNLIVVENVVDARHWVMWDAWLHAMQCLGYEWQVVYFNSMFAHPTPQSRDRMYVVFHKRGNRKPNLDIRPRAWCERCVKDVQGVQTWKNGARAWGRYGKNGQYIYTCPECRQQIRPYYYPAFTAIDWSLPAERIGDRKKPLKERTLARIQLGVDRFKDQHLVMDILYSHAHNNRSHPVTEPWPTQTGQQSLALVRMPWLMQVNQSGDRMREVTQPLPTQTASLENAIVTAHAEFFPSPFLVEEHGTSTVRPIDGPQGTVMEGGNHHYLAMPFLSSYYGTDNVRAVAEAAGTMTGIDRHALVTPMPFVVHQSSSDGAHSVRPATDPLPTLCSIPHHRLALPRGALTVDDCGFRMLEPHEIGAAMAFPPEYKVLGNKREKVKQYGNAVTPPMMDILIERGMESLGSAA